MNDDAHYFKPLQDLPLGWDIIVAFDEDRQEAIRCCQQIRSKGRQSYVVAIIPDPHATIVHHSVWAEPV